MVKITRRPMGPRRVIGGKKSSASSSSSIFTLRNLFVSLVMIQGLRMLMRTSTTDVSPSPSNIDAAAAAGHGKPLGLKETLNKSVASGGGGSGVRGGNNKEQPKQQVVEHVQHDESKDKDKDVVHTELPATEEPESNNESNKDKDNDHKGQELPATEEPEAKHTDAPEEGKKEDEATTKTPDEGGAAAEATSAVVVAAAAAVALTSADLNPIVINKKGTGPTNVGYVKDFVHERKNPVYRNLVTNATDPSHTVAKLVNEKKVIACQTINSSDGKMTQNPKCLDPDTPLIAYNPESFTRTWCGQEIKPKSAIVMTEHCTDPIAHLFPAEVPPITGEHMPPIIIKSSADKELLEGELEKVQCNIPCQQEKGVVLGLSGKKDNNSDRFIDGETWKITQTLEDTKGLKMERTDFMKEQFYSTRSLISSAPLSTFDTKIHSLRNRPAVDFDTAKEAAIYLVENQCSAHSTKRDRWFSAVNEQMTVDSYGHCGHNIEVPEGMTITTPEGRIALTKQYRIVLAFDESSSKDHISDMVWEAFASGAVPVVIGADNIRDRLPPKSFINVSSFSKWGELADYVKKVVSDKELWHSYHKWREDEAAVTAFENQYEFTQTDPTCRLCRWAYAKKYGLGWDHTKQEVRSISKVPKDKFCITADHGLVSKPFSEQWVTKKSGGQHDDEKVLEEDSEGESCSSLGTDGDIVVDSFKGHRNVHQHDGVTDFIITESNDESTDDGAETMLRLKFPHVRNPDGACFYNTHTLVSTTGGSKVSSASIQDDLVKVTILANWETTVRSSGEGIMEVVIGANKSSNNSDDGSPPRRVRIIIEEMSQIHDKMTEFFPSSYCKRMTKDFIDPIGIFFVDSS